MEENSFSGKLREELGKMKKMSWGERLQYIWDYYKPLLVGILAVIFVISTVVQVIHNMHLNYLVSSYWVNSAGMLIDTDAVEARFKEYLGDTSDKDVVTVDVSVMINNSAMSQMTMASQMKLTTMIATGDVDLVLFDEDMYRDFLNSGGMQPVSAFCTEEQFARWKDLLSEDTSVSEDNEGNKTEVTDFYAVRVEDSPVLKEFQAYPEGQEVYAVFTPAGKHPEMAAEFVDFLLDPAKSWASQASAAESGRG